MYRCIHVYTIILCSETASSFAGQRLSTRAVETTMFRITICLAREGLMKSRLSVCVREITRDTYVLKISMCCFAELLRRLVCVCFVNNNDAGSFFETHNQSLSYSHMGYGFYQRARIRLPGNVKTEYSVSTVAAATVAFSPKRHMSSR